MTTPRHNSARARRNLDRLSEATQELTLDERRAALNYLLGALSGSIPATQWDDAVANAVTFVEGMKRR